MYCKNCGSEMNENAAVCLNCGAAKNVGNSYCANCGAEVNDNAAVCLNCGASIGKKARSGNVTSSGGVSDKTKTAAGLLAIFLGNLGIHWFYLGYKEKGIINIVISVMSLVILIIPIIGLILGIAGFTGLLVYNIIVAVRIFGGKLTDNDGNDLS